MEHDFVIWHDTPTPARGSGAQRRRDTSRPVRDRLIRNVLKTVTEPYVIPLDADSFRLGTWRCWSASWSAVSWILPRCVLCRVIRKSRC